MRTLKIDITYDCDIRDAAGQQAKHMGLQCCELIKRRMKEYPEGMIEGQILVLKKFLALRDLNSPYHGTIIYHKQQIIGGLSSYGLLVLLIGFLNSDPLSLL